MMMFAVGDDKTTNRGRYCPEHEAILATARWLGNACARACASNSVFVFYRLHIEAEWGLVQNQK